MKTKPNSKAKGAIARAGVKQAGAAIEAKPKRRPSTAPGPKKGGARKAGAAAQEASAGAASVNGHVRAVGAPVDGAARAGGPAPKPRFTLEDPETRVYVGDCREIIPGIPECAAKSVDLVFADPPFNWQVKYDRWHDGLPRDEYLNFTRQWLDACVDALAEHGSIWVNIPDDTAAEIVVHLKSRGLVMINWCVWHFRFGQNRMGSFIMSKVHALYFARSRENRRWNPDEILEPSDRATTYFDPRTHNKAEGPNGMRVPMDVWYGKYWGRVQGNNKERRHNHQNQLPEVYLERVVRACSRKGDLVMDPFLGSGTTGLLARALGRRSIGVEYSPENARSAFDRIGRGPLRLGEAINQPTAIFAPRRKNPRAPKSAQTD